MGTLCWSKHICYIPFCTIIANDNNKLKKFWKYIFNAVFHAESEYVISFYVRSLVNVLYGRMGDRILEILYWENFGNMSKWDIMMTLTYELYVWKNKQFQMIFFVYKWITYKKYILFFWDIMLKLTYTLLWWNIANDNSKLKKIKKIHFQCSFLCWIWICN